MKRNLLYILMMVLLQAGCSNNSKVATPRPVAYPRIQLADTFYTEVEQAKPMLTILANAQTRRQTVKNDDSTLWIDIIYDIYGGSVIHLSVQHLSKDKLPEALANRMQRIEMNVGSNHTELTELKNTNFEGIVVKAANADVTPVQMLAYDNNNGTLIYGSLEMKSRGDTEMIKPIVDAVEQDMIKMVSSL
ncbi:MAG: hypothetical protein NC343_06200 [Muribaculum sp.]|nr:hypothetical protein [Muribaculaceae bacterium]MCM1081325.1 hypothetical protein [Muribaculum sp.]